MPKSPMMSLAEVGDPVTHQKTPLEVRSLNVRLLLFVFIYVTLTFYFSCVLYFYAMQFLTVASFFSGKKYQEHFFFCNAYQILRRQSLSVLLTTTVLKLISVIFFVERRNKRARRKRTPKRNYLPTMQISSRRKAALQSPSWSPTAVVQQIMSIQLVQAHSELPKSPGAPSPWLQEFSSHKGGPLHHHRIMRLPKVISQVHYRNNKDFCGRAKNVHTVYIMGFSSFLLANYMLICTLSCVGGIPPQKGAFPPLLFGSAPPEFLEKLLLKVKEQWGGTLGQEMYPNSPLHCHFAIPLVKLSCYLKLAESKVPKASLLFAEAIKGGNSWLSCTATFWIQIEKRSHQAKYGNKMLTLDSHNIFQTS